MRSAAPVSPIRRLPRTMGIAEEEVQKVLKTLAEEKQPGWMIFFIKYVQIGLNIIRYKPVEEEIHIHMFFFKVFCCFLFLKQFQGKGLWLY